MAIFFKRVQRANPIDKEAARKWYARLKTVGQKKEKEIAQLLSDETTLNPKEAEMALSQFQKILVRILLDGHSVQLSDWGSFYLTCNSTGHDSEEEVSATSIAGLNIRFKPGNELKEAIAKAHFLAADSLIK